MENLTKDFSGGLFIWQTILIITFILWMYSLLDILKSKYQKNDKIVWILIVILMPIFGAIVYVFIGRKQKLKTV